MILNKKKKVCLKQISEFGKLNYLLSALIKCLIFMHFYAFIYLE